MKAFKKLALLAVLLTAAFGFVSCSDDDDGPSVVTTWTTTQIGTEYTLCFYDDNTGTYTTTTSAQSTTLNVTYTGDTTKAGADIVVKLTDTGVSYIYKVSSDGKTLEWIVSGYTALTYKKK